MLRDHDAELVGSFKIDEDLELGRQLDRKVRGFSSLEDVDDVISSAAVLFGQIRAIGDQPASAYILTFFGH